MTKNILGLDLGTNSIGWALIRQDFENKHGEILGMGSRIIPMSQDILGDFGKGNSVSQTAERTKYRSIRRLRERFLLRRERLHRVLRVLNFLPEHYSSQIDFEKRFGKFKVESEPKLAWKNIGRQFSFLFQASFNDMLEDFKAKGQDLKIPYDWTIYFLRKKALSQKIEKEELAWILLNFNQKRGYYQLRGEEEEENPNKQVEFYSLKVIDVLVDEPQKGKSDMWYSLILENGWIYRRSSKIPLFDWKDKTQDFIVTTDLNDDGSIKKDKEGSEKRSFRAPSENDWTLVKKKTEQEIEQSHKTVGAYIYEALLDNPKQKIKGKLVRTIERKFYKEELRQILEKQKEFHQELQNDDLHNDCIRELYPNNEAHQLTLSKKDLVHLLMDDLIFYQRPLRSQKSSISNCTLEFRKYKDENRIEHTQYLKAIPKSNPYYQEFRLWQWMFNLNIYRKDDEANVTKEFLNTDKDFENLFEFLNHRKEIEQKPLIKFLLEQKEINKKLLNAEAEKYRWNYVENKKYPCSETKTMISSRLDKVDNISDDFLTRDIEQKIWHIIYSVNDKVEYEKALKSFARKHHLDGSSFFEAFRKFPPFKSEYGSFSEKAIKKLLPLMRLGKYWNYADIDQFSKDRIQKIINGEYDENIKDKVREKAINLTSESDFRGLQLWLAQYIIYGRHSEASMIGKWNSADDLEMFLKDFKQHSLRNPIVEQVITETLRVVKDIWLKYGNGAKDFFNEIHIELGREMKLPADDRKKLTNQITENENTNLRIKALLAEMMNDSSVENVRPFSPMQQEILKIYEDGVLNSDVEIEDDILKISKTAQPSPSDLKRYKLWLEQKYKSPYTGQIIPLNKLFTPEYEIEHIIPQSRYFDDSFSNKVICESAVNKLKDNYIGLEFIKKLGGTVVECGNGKSVTVLKEDQYEDFVKKHYANNRSKRNKLLLEGIPEKMIERQLNDTRYISKYISGILSSIVRVQDGSDEGVNSKNIVPGNGKITTQLKQDWGLNDVWNDLILPRFERVNQLTNSTDFTVWNENYQKFLPTVPIEYSKGFSKKRIDHRHHALDALVIACATKEHINYMNNEHALRKSKTKEEKQGIRYDLRQNLCYKKYNGESNENYKWIFIKPWENFTVEAKNSLEKIIVSFKQNLRVINKATNHYEKYVEKDGVKTKERVEQKGSNWAIRKSLHEETVSGKIDLPWVDTGKGEFITATRKPLDTSFNFDKIKKITDTGIQKILRNYLEAKDNNPELAFSPEGIEDLNKNIEKYNEGKTHQPIIKVRVYEKGKGRFALGQTGNKVYKYVQGSPNLFFAIYNDENGKKSFDSIRLDILIERMKQMLSPVPEVNSNGDELCETLSPLDLVYIPTEEESENIDVIDFNTINKSKLERIYNVNDFSGYTVYFSQNSFAKNIYPKEMDLSWNVKKEKASGSFDSKTASFNGKSIKDSFIKLKIDRLGNISKT
ncbi:type II CRISPR RNA-guided endonuclease Cas9 [uncultured Chryseobacterium sp.]|uniref:type II CRISPR RNA-guided endonuclease Cas9 n=1 Tax=uncultured Chryseobacterium sp. TaxID=259322 RepID=UPI002586D378|nr:type II CRISPR RNA-guided endonuclease Cas9 [uncultured Chryseobacterium sp.]